MDVDGWWLMMDVHGSWWMVADGCWWLLVDDCWWMLTDVDGCWQMLMDIDGWWWMMTDVDECWQMLMDVDGLFWFMMVHDGWWISWWLNIGQIGVDGYGAWSCMIRFYNAGQWLWWMVSTRHLRSPTLNSPMALPCITPTWALVIQLHWQTDQRVHWHLQQKGWHKLSRSTSHSAVHKRM